MSMNDVVVCESYKVMGTSDDDGCVSVVTAGIKYNNYIKKQTLRYLKILNYKGHILFSVFSSQFKLQGIFSFINYND